MWANRHTLDKKINWNLRIHSKYKFLVLGNLLSTENDYHHRRISKEARDKVFKKYKEDWTTTHIKSC